MIEVKKVSCRQDTHGEWFVTIKLHPNDVDNGLVKSQPGTVFNISYEVAEDALPDRDSYVIDTSVGARIRTRAVLLCKDERFQEWIGDSYRDGPSEETAKKYVRAWCDIRSRSELAINVEAQNRFLELERRYREETGQVAEARG